MNGRQFGAPEPRSTPERVPVSSRQVSSESNAAFDTARDNSGASLRSTLETERNRSSHRAKREKHPGSRRGLMITIWVVVAILVLAAAWFFGSKLFAGGALAGIDKSGYQAVFLTNGQTYFGKLTASGTEYLKLTDVYYLDSQSSDTGDATDADKKTDSETANQNSLQLFKMTDATVIGPDDAMYISTKQVLLYENLKPDSKVVQSIQKYQ